MFGFCDTKDIFLNCLITSNIKTLGKGGLVLIHGIERLPTLISTVPAVPIRCVLALFNSDIKSRYHLTGLAWLITFDFDYLKLILGDKSPSPCPS
jgi:hypothetical protein